VALALGIGGVFALLNALCGRQVFAALGGSDEVLNVATTYASIVFTGAFGMWIFNTLAAILRGAGRMGLPSLIGAGVALSTMFLSPAFVLGLGPFPRLGVAGAGVVAVAYQLLAMSVLLVFMTTSGSPLRLRWPSRFEIRHFRAVLGIAGPSALSTVVTNLTIVVFTGAFGAMGAHGLAAYGAISRLEYLFMLGTFGLGMALAPMVSANLAAGHVERARQCAWIGAGLCAALTGLPGLVLALQPELWVGLFSREPAAVEIGARYLRTVAPFYGLLGASLGLFFAAQGLALARSAFAWNGARLVVLATLLVAVGAAGVRSAGVLGWVAAAGFAFYATGLAITVARGGRPPPDDCDR
jgi:Na+-driven multidrug efflux pump